MNKKPYLVEVKQITSNGLTIILKGKEYFAAFKNFPDFVSVPVAHLFDVKFWGGEFLSWEKADIDICLESLNHPEKFFVNSRAHRFTKKDAGDATHALFKISQLYSNVEHCECENCEKARRISENTLNVILGRKE